MLRATTSKPSTLVDDAGKPRSQRAFTTQNQKESFYANDDVDLTELMRREKVQGVQRYDDNYAHHILRQGKKFKPLDVDHDDEVSALSWYEGRQSHIEKTKREVLQRKQEINDKRLLRRKRVECSLCIESEAFTKARMPCILGLTTNAYLSYQNFKQCAIQGHMIIAPIAHANSLLDVDDEVYTDIRNYQKAIVSFLDEQEEAAIFVETVANIAEKERVMLGGGGHACIEVFPLPASRLREAKSYFRKAFQEAGSWWSENKKIVEVKGNRGVAGAIPKGFPYVHVDFSLDREGLAYLIDDVREFPRHFARDVLMGLLELDALHKPFRDFKGFIAEVEKVKKEFSRYDWAAAGVRVTGD